MGGTIDEATRRIRESGEADVPIIAVTAHALAGDSTKCLHAGMNDFLSKPIDMAQLAQVCARWLPPAGSGGGDHPRL